MQWQLLLFGMVPIAVFAAMDATGRRRQAIPAAIAVAAIEAVYNSLQLGFAEPFSWASLALFVVLGAISLATDRDVYFKLQPVALGIGCAAAIWIHDGVTNPGAPLLPLILEKHVGINEVLPPYQKGYFQGYAATMATSLPYLLVAHAALTAYAALRWSTLWWFLIRVPGFYLLVVTLFYAERILRVTY